MQPVNPLVDVQLTTLLDKLKSSKYGSQEAVEHITRRFDETTKRLFRDDRSLQFISFGSPLDKDPAVGIRGGQLKLTGLEVRDLFEPSIEGAFLLHMLELQDLFVLAAFNAIKMQIDASAGMIKVCLLHVVRRCAFNIPQSVWLVGGFAANHWLFSQLQERLAPYNVAVNRPDSQTCVRSLCFSV
jgi:hypothetical protein